MKIEVFNRRKKRRTPLADALFNAAAKIMRGNGDRAQASTEVVAIYRKMNNELKDATGLMHFLEEVFAGIRAFKERDRRERSQKIRRTAFETVN